jgi:hypothetical protein
MNMPTISTEEIEALLKELPGPAEAMQIDQASRSRESNLSQALQLLMEENRSLRRQIELAKADGDAEKVPATGEKTTLTLAEAERLAHVLQLLLWAPQGMNFELNDDDSDAIYETLGLIKKALQNAQTTERGKQ